MSERNGQRSHPYGKENISTNSAFLNKILMGIYYISENSTSTDTEWERTVMEKVVLDGKNLTLDQIYEVVYHGAIVEL
ncbi:MAG: hypothetical protein ACLRMZ_20205 [Blautia marasmi]